MRTHIDERPYHFPVCGKAFTRQNDFNRHHRFHLGERKFTCRGVFRSGSSWGCNMSYSRAETLGCHFRSEVDRVCIRPLLEEKQRERVVGTSNLSRLTIAISCSARISNQEWRVIQFNVRILSFYQQHLQDQQLPAVLPSALLAQFPALATIDWRQTQSSNSNMDEGHLSDEYDDPQILSNVKA